MGHYKDGNSWLIIQCQNMQRQLLPLRFISRLLSDNSLLSILMFVIGYCIIYCSCHHICVCYTVALHCFYIKRLLIFHIIVVVNVYKLYSKCINICLHSEKKIYESSVNRFIIFLRKENDITVVKGNTLVMEFLFMH